METPRSTFMSIFSWNYLKMHLVCPDCWAPTTTTFRSHWRCGTCTTRHRILRTPRNVSRNKIWNYKMNMAKVPQCFTRWARMYFSTITRSFYTFQYSLCQTPVKFHTIGTVLMSLINFISLAFSSLFFTTAHPLYCDHPQGYYTT